MKGWGGEGEEGGPRPGLNKMSIQVQLNVIGSFKTLNQCFSTGEYIGRIRTNKTGGFESHSNNLRTSRESEGMGEERREGRRGGGLEPGLYLKG